MGNSALATAMAHLPSPFALRFSTATEMSEDIPTYGVFVFFYHSSMHQLLYEYSMGIAMVNNRYGKQWPW